MDMHFTFRSIRHFAFACIAIAYSTRAYSQDVDPKLPDSSSHKVEAAGEKPESQANREITWRTVSKDFLRDQKAIFWKFPSQLAKGQHLLPTLAVVGGTATLIAPPIAQAMTARKFRIPVLMLRAPAIGSQIFRPGSS
jgi:hypothetical protein